MSDLYDLAERAVACKHWRWMPGMAVLRCAPGTPAHGHRQPRVDDECVTYEQALNVHIMPDLSDPATLGCLLHLVRERWQLPLRTPGTCPGDDGEPDYYTMRIYQEYAEGDTEAECLVDALEMEAAP